MCVAAWQVLRALQCFFVIIQGQHMDAPLQRCLSRAEDFGMVADAVIAACRGVVCWEGDYLKVVYCPQLILTDHCFGAL